MEGDESEQATNIQAPRSAVLTFKKFMSSDLHPLPANFLPVQRSNLIPPGQLDALGLSSFLVQTWVTARRQGYIPAAGPM